MSTVTSLCQSGDLKTAYAQAEAYLNEHLASSFAQADMYLVMREFLKKAVAENDVVAATRCVAKLAALGFPLNGFQSDKLFWELRPLLFTLSKRQPLPGLAVAKLLEALTGVEVAPEASRGRSVLLQMALKFKEFLPVGWWAWWDLDLLMPEDFKTDSFTPAGTSKAVQQPALVETACGACVRQLIKRIEQPAGMSAFAASIATTMGTQAREEAAVLLPRLEQLAEAHPEYNWMGFHRAKLLVALGGDLAGALAALLPVVRRKSTEFWSWSLLGETLCPTDKDTALACYYKASTCRSEEMYLGKVRETLANLLREAGHLGEAQLQLRLLVKGKEAEGLRPSYAVSQLITQAWFLADYSGEQRQTVALRQAWLENAEQAAYGDLPWQPVVLQFISEETLEKPAMVRLLPASAGEEVRPLSVPLKKYRWLGKLPAGAPLQVRSESVASRLKVVQVKERAEGKPWDVVPAQIAVVSGITADKARAFFSIRPGLNGAIQLAESKLVEVSPGDAVRVRLQARVKEGITRHFVLAAELTVEVPDASVCREFKGPLRMHAKGFGFADNIFLPAQLINQRGWQEGETITGRAVLSHNKLKNKDEWSAARIDF